MFTLPPALLATPIYRARTEWMDLRESKVPLESRDQEVSQAPVETRELRARV